MSISNKSNTHCALTQMRSPMPWPSDWWKEPIWTIKAFVFNGNQVFFWCFCFYRTTFIWKWCPQFVETSKKSLKDWRISRTLAKIVISNRKKNSLLLSNKSLFSIDRVSTILLPEDISKNILRIEMFLLFKPLIYTRISFVELFFCCIQLVW